MVSEARTIRIRARLRSLHARKGQLLLAGLAALGRSFHGAANDFQSWCWPGCLGLPGCSFAALEAHPVVDPVISFSFGLDNAIMCLATGSCGGPGHGDMLPIMNLTTIGGCIGMMTKILWIVVPYAAGALGAFLLTEFPAVYQSMCNGGV